MKTIKLTDEMYNFLIELSKEMSTQDLRCTAMPYFFQVESDRMRITAEGCGIEAWHFDGNMLETDEEIRTAIFEYKEWDEDLEEDINKYEELDGGEIEEILIEAGYRKVNYEYENVYTNSFLTEKACKQHIKANSYHYNNPQDYLTHAFRNPELEKVIEFILSLTDNKLHK